MQHTASHALSLLHHLVYLHCYCQLRSTHIAAIILLHDSACHVSYTQLQQAITACTALLTTMTANHFIQFYNRTCFIISS